MKIAVVIDVSGSMEKHLDLFALDHRLKVIPLKSSGGCDLKQLQELTTKYDKVFFFTDGIFSVNWQLILDPDITVINVERRF